jgi:hypothetical protein
VEAAVGRIAVLALTGRAHGEAGHGCARPVVGDARDDGEPRPAIRAVDERVAVAPIRRVEQLGEAVTAGGRVRRDQCVSFPAGVAGRDREARLLGRRERPHRDVFDHCQRWRLLDQSVAERVDIGGPALDLDVDAFHIVADESGEVQPRRQREHEGPEADALDDALDPDASPPTIGH